jgi:ASF1 like histone chaperone
MSSAKQCINAHDAEWKCDHDATMTRDSVTDIAGASARPGVDTMGGHSRGDCHLVNMFVQGGSAPLTILDMLCNCKCSADIPIDDVLMLDIAIFGLSHQAVPIRPSSCASHWCTSCQELCMMLLLAAKLLLVQEFLRVGYYAKTDYEDEALRENPPEKPDVDKCAAPHPRNMVSSYV